MRNAKPHLAVVVQHLARSEAGDVNPRGQPRVACRRGERAVRAAPSPPADAGPGRRNHAADDPPFGPGSPGSRAPRLIRAAPHPRVAPLADRCGARIHGHLARAAHPLRDALRSPSGPAGLTEAVAWSWLAVTSPCRLPFARVRPAGVERGAAECRLGASRAGRLPRGLGGRGRDGCARLRSSPTSVCAEAAALAVAGRTPQQWPALHGRQAPHRRPRGRGRAHRSDLRSRVRAARRRPASARCPDVGTLIDTDAALRLESRVAAAVGDGARLLQGGEPDGAEVVSPVLARVLPAERARLRADVRARCSGDRVSGLGEAIAVANGTRYGLSPGLPVFHDLAAVPAASASCGAARSTFARCPASARRRRRSAASRRRGWGRRRASSSPSVR